MNFGWGEHKHSDHCNVLRFLSCNILFLLSPLPYISLVSNLFPLSKVILNVILLLITAPSPSFTYTSDRNFTTPLALYTHIFSGTFLLLSSGYFCTFFYIEISFIYSKCKNLNCTTWWILHMHILVQQPLRSRRGTFPSSQKVPLCFLSVNNHCQLPQVNDCFDIYHHQLVFMSLNFK